MKPCTQLLIFIWTIVFYSQAHAQERYKLYCLYTSQYEQIYQQFFLPSIQDDFELIAKEYPQDCPTSSFKKEGWDKTMLNKLDLLRQAILDNWGGQVFLYSDLDVIFLKPILESCLFYLGNKDFVVQHGWPPTRLCAGFFVMRGNEKTLKLIETAYELLQQGSFPDDQEALQFVLDNTPPEEINWGLLPSNLYPIGKHVFKNHKRHYTEDASVIINKVMLLVHANWCVGLDKKIHFLKRIQESQSLENK